MPSGWNTENVKINSTRKAPALSTGPFLYLIMFENLLSGNEVKRLDEGRLSSGLHLLQHILRHC
jgi:hypothetical protein